MSHKLHPQLPDDIDAIEEYAGCWPADRPFPLSPGECMALVMGYAVRPRQPMTMEDFGALPGAWEGGPRHRIVLHRK